jgi:hypothetical protein
MDEKKTYFFLIALGNAFHRLLDSCLAPKGYWIAPEQFLKVIEKPRGNAQIKLMTAGQMFFLAGCDETSIEDKADLPNGY